MDFSPRPKGFNAPEARRSFDETAGLLASQIEAVCRHLLPAGRKISGEWRVGSVAGQPGRSMGVHLGGHKIGWWKDFDSGEGGGDLIALWAEVRGIKMIEAKAEAEAWLGVSNGRSSAAEHRSPKPSVEGSSPSVRATTPSRAPEDPDWWRKIKPTAKWDYFDRDGVLFGTVFRFDDPNGQHKKEIRPWDGRDWKSPEGQRPLYNLPGILRAPRDATIVLVEGEKCADAVNEVGDPLTIATTIWGGAAAASRTEWSTLAGRNVLRWADNDHPRDGKPTGRDVWLRTTREHLEAAGATIRDVAIDGDKPDGWDAADALPDERRSIIEAHRNSEPVHRGKPRRKLAESTARALFVGEPPPQLYLVDKVFPLGRACVFAAPGDTGKGMLMLDLAAKVATPALSMGFDANPLRAFGHEIPHRGRAVILSAEDDTAEMHRRLARLHPDLPDDVRERIHILPYPDMEDRMPIFITGDIKDLKTTQEFEDIRAELKGLTNLRLIVVDPAYAFAAVDLTEPAVAQFASNTMDKLAKETGATVIVCHHTTKGDSRYPIRTLADARKAIAGSAQLINAVRCAYVLWHAEQDEATIRTNLKLPPAERSVYYGGVAKSNAPADPEKHTFIRHAVTGLLQIDDSVNDLMNVVVDDDLRRLVIDAITKFNKAQHPVSMRTITKSGDAGKDMHRMPARWQKLGEKERSAIIRSMLARKELMTTNPRNRLCVPEDNYAKGDARDNEVAGGAAVSADEE